MTEIKFTFKYLMADNFDEQDYLANLNKGILDTSNEVVDYE